MHVRTSRHLLKAKAQSTASLEVHCLKVRFVRAAQRSSRVSVSAIDQHVDTRHQRLREVALVYTIQAGR